MTMKQTPLQHANLAHVYGQCVHILIRSMRTYWPEVSVNDLKAGSVVGSMWWKR